MSGEVDAGPAAAPAGDVVDMAPVQPVILSGGSGTRLWPLSREHYPKQLLPLIGNDSLLQSTARRLEPWHGRRRILAPIVVGNEEYRFIAAAQMQEAGHPARSLILEPGGRNTAPALTLAALEAQRVHPGGSDPILVAMPADQVVRDNEVFCRAMETGADLAAMGAIVTFGIAPEHPETGYGYLKTGAALTGSDALQLKGFVEKPDLELATRFIAEGGYFWNSGVYMVRASVWLAAIERHAPGMAAGCAEAWEKSQREPRNGGEFVHVDRDAFLAIAGDSIDYAVMEPLSANPGTALPVVVPMAPGWSDVGNWEALWRVAEKDGEGNVVQGDSLLEDVGNSLVIAQGRLVVCLGIQNTVVVETPDAVFVAAAERAAEVRSLVSRLKSLARNEAAHHRKQHRPWGYYDSIDRGERFHVKRIVVQPGAALSLQMHHHRAEHWIVVRGTARVTRGDESLLLAENESTYIPLGVPHRLENPGKLPLELIEVQSGAYLGEDDIVRFGDHYGRAVGGSGGDERGEGEGEGLKPPGRGRH